MSAGADGAFAMTISYRWRVVAGVFVVLMASSGFGFYNLAVYMNALAEQRDFAVADLSGAIAALFVATGIAGLGVGRLMAVWSVRWIMLAGAACGGVALSLIGHAQTIWQVWLLYAAFGVGNAAVSLIPATTVVTRWFPHRDRSVALSVASTGLSVGGVTLTPASALVLQHFGVDAAMPWFGALFFLVIAPIAWTLRDWPDEPRAGHAPAPPDAAAVRAALRSRFFVGAAVAWVLAMGAQVGVIAHIFNHADKAAGAAVASSAVSVLAACSIMGRLIGGVVVKRFPIRAFTLLNMFAQGLGIAALAFGETPAALLIAAACFGLTVGNLLMLQPLLMAEAFGVRDYPRIYSVANLTMTAGIAGGPLLMGVLHDLHSYLPAFLAASGASFLALGAFCAAGALPSPYAAMNAPRR